MDLVKKIIALHKALNAAALPHAFGGALALAWCTQRARGTIDIDLNIFVAQDDYEKVLDSLPVAIQITKQQRRALKKDGQARLFWNKTPVDIFLNSTPFHHNLVERRRYESFGGTTVPFLSCNDLAVFKAFFNRSRDWADLEEMCEACTIDVTTIRATLVNYLGAEDDRVVRLDDLGKRMD
jgi:hypothetical protein